LSFIFIHFNYFFLPFNFLIRIIHRI
jgi:hypothetical protein